jgi:DNA-binding PadR family transcriptional regulator
LTRLVILSILKQRPMHGYEIQQIIQEQKFEQWTDILSGSIYFALNQMEKEELIRAEGEERTGNRIRKIYAITKQGGDAYLQLLREALASPPHSLKSGFSLALGMAYNLSVEERSKILRQNIRNLEELRQFWKKGQAIKSKFHPALKALFENDLELIERDMRFLQELLTINVSEAGNEPPVPAKATHLIIKTSGTYSGNPYTYEEIVPIEKYAVSQWWSWFQPKRVKETLRKIPEAVEGDVFTINDPLTKTITEIRAITREE